MTNQLITSSHPQLPAKCASTTQANGMSDMQTIETFCALLAQQMDEAGTPVLIAPSSAIAPSPAIAIDTKTTADTAKLARKVDLDKTLATTDIPSDSVSALAAMLQLPQEIKTPALKDATSRTTVAVCPMASSEAASHQPSANINAIQAQTKLDMAITDNQVARSTSSLEIANSAVLANNMPRTSPPTQDVTPSIVASAIMPNMLVNNRLLDSRQTIATPLGNSGWAGEFSQKINWVSTQQNQVAELHLNPPDLGPLNVVLKISDNQATALFTSPHSAVRDAVENALPKLRETLADNGITLGNTTVSDQPPRDRNAERFMNQDCSAAAQREGSGEAFGSKSLLTAGAQIASVRRHNGMVDTFA